MLRHKRYNSVSRSIEEEFELDILDCYIRYNQPTPRDLMVISLLRNPVVITYKDAATILAKADGKPPYCRNLVAIEVDRIVDAGLQTVRLLTQEEKSADFLNLGLSNRTLGPLTKARITTIEQLTEYTADDLLDIKNFGVGCLREVEEKLASIGKALPIEM